MLSDENSAAQDQPISEISPEETGARGALPPFVLALDIGTSSVRAAIYDAHAREINGTATRMVRSFATTPDGGAESNAETLIAEVARVVDGTLGLASALAAGIQAVATTCFWHSLLGTTAAGEALTPVYGWADTRAAAETVELRRRFDERAAHTRTGCRFHPGYWPAKLLWLQREHGAVCRAVAQWMSFGEFLAWRLAGTGTGASISMASGTGLLDQRRCVWDDELLAGLGLSIAQLPHLTEMETGASVFTLAGGYAGRWPQLHGRPWFAAVGDGATNNIGVGCTTPDRMALMIGTSGAMRLLYEGAPPAEIHPGLWCYRADRRRVVVGGALSDGGGLYGWLRGALALSGVDAEATERALAALEPDAHGLTILPFWAGERSTGWNASARGAILGLTMHTRPLEIVRAALEAIAYRFALIAEALEPYAPGAEIYASGGALWASALWTQILADVLERPLRIRRVREASSRGAVLLALEALGTIKTLAELPTAPSGLVCEPNAAHYARYRAGLERQKKFYELLINDRGSDRPSV